MKIQKLLTIETAVNFIVAIAFLLSLLHVIWLINYNFSALSGKENIDNPVPVFVHNYKVFAPDAPQENFTLYVWDSLSVKWINPSSDYLAESQNNRFSKSRYLYLIYQESLREIRSAMATAEFYFRKNQIKINATEFIVAHLEKKARLNNAKNFLKYALRNKTQFNNNRIKCCIYKQVVVFNNVHNKNAQKQNKCIFFFMDIS